MLSGPPDTAMPRRSSRGISASRSRAKRSRTSCSIRHPELVQGVMSSSGPPSQWTLKQQPISAALRLGFAVRLELLEVRPDFRAVDGIEFRISLAGLARLAELH